MADEQKIGGAAVYVPWATFSNALVQLAQGIPNRIDRSVFQGQSGSVQSQLLAGLRFLGLINDGGRPLPALYTVAVTDEAERKVALRKIIEEKYSALIALDLTKTTPHEFAERMGASYGVSGDTREKAIRFFLAAASYVGIPVSSYLSRDKSPKAGNGGTARKRRPRAPKNEELPQAAPVPTADNGTSRTISLQSGGTLTVSATIDLFRMSAADRVFVFKLIDDLEKYESEAAQ